MRIITALVTPFLEDGSIDFDSLDLLVREQEAAGNGLLLLGSTAEALALEFDERLAILRHVSSQNLKVPLLVGVGGFQLPETLRWLKICETFPIAGYLMVTPIYARPGPNGQIEWFKTLLDSVSKPCMLYNHPMRVGCSLATEVLQQLRDHPNLWAIKEASDSFEQSRLYKEVAPDIELYSGCDDFAPDEAVGLVSVAANVWPQKLPDLSLLRLVNQNNPVSVKKLLHALGKIKTPYLRPPLSEKDGAEVADLLAQEVLL